MDGAVFQSYAVDMALRGPSELNIESFCDDLQKKMKQREENEGKDAKRRKVETEDDKLPAWELNIDVYMSIIFKAKHTMDYTWDCILLSCFLYLFRVKSSSEFPYTNIVDEIRKYAMQDTLPSSEEIFEILGNVISMCCLFGAALHLLAFCI